MIDQLLTYYFFSFNISFALLTFVTGTAIILYTLMALQEQEENPSTDEKQYSVVTTTSKDKEVKKKASKLLRHNNIDEVVVIQESSKRKAGITKHIDDQLVWIKKRKDKIKKPLLHYAIEKTNNKNIIEIPWGSEITEEFFKQEKTSFATGPIKVKHKDSLFSKLKAVETVWQTNYLNKARNINKQNPVLNENLKTYNKKKINFSKLDNNLRDLLLTLQITKQKDKKITYTDQIASERHIFSSKKEYQKEKGRELKGYSKNLKRIFQDLKAIEHPEKITNIVVTPLISFIGVFSAIALIISSLGTGHLLYATPFILYPLFAYTIAFTVVLEKDQSFKYETLDAVKTGFTLSIAQIYSIITSPGKMVKF